MTATRTLEVRPHFWNVGDRRDDPTTCVEWERRSAQISGADGKVFFTLPDVEVPKSWSQLALNVTASKYLHGRRLRSVRDLVVAVCREIARWAVEDGYVTAADGEVLFAELVVLVLTQRMAFNSPVWFNVGVATVPQCSACFIQGVDDTMESILGLLKTEGLLFKRGSGTGSNFSRLRGSKELLSDGAGTASGPVSFCRALDKSAGVIKSGGRTRRAAKMLILDDDHPDVEEFAECKAVEERKAWALIDAGYDGSFNGEAYRSVDFQNGNNSVRVTDAFMRAVLEDGPWSTRWRTTGEVAETFPARRLWRKMALAAWTCGCPGVQFHDTINGWHTCPMSGPIRASNPCSEYMHLDDSACNLASLNLRKFQFPPGHPSAGQLDVEDYRAAVDVTVLAMDVLVDRASYPTPKIAANAKRFRQLGLGYANLGALLMARGLPYASAAGRDYAAAVTSVLGGRAYRRSAEIAAARGPFAGFAENRAPMLAVLDRHRREAERLATDPTIRGEAARLADEGHRDWVEAGALGAEVGFRNAQATVLAPTGTIGFMMDVDTTGIECSTALVTYKQLVGGGQFKIVNQTVGDALEALGYDRPSRKTILHHVETQDTIEGAPGLAAEHLAVFDGAFRPAKGTRCLAPLDHVRMVAAVQPFLSGAVSKTVNLPSDATPEHIAEIYGEAWKLGLKAVAVYRDGAKRTQPVAVKPEGAKSEGDGRKRMPPTRDAKIHKFSVAGHEGYIEVGLYPDTRQPGEVFVRMAKEGSTVSGMLNAWACALSLLLQRGGPLVEIVRKFRDWRFEPAGLTDNADIRFATSIVDYVARFLELTFLTPTEQAVSKQLDTAVAGNVVGGLSGLHGPSCQSCGMIMSVRVGPCWKCGNCGDTSGGCS